MKVCIFLLYAVAYEVVTSASENSSLPVKIPHIVSGKCQRPFLVNSTNIQDELSSANRLLTQQYGPPGCTCGGIGSWRRVAYLDMSDLNQQCPSNWSLIEDPDVRACAGLTAGCHSAFFSTDQFTYNHVCGRVLAYQKGTPDGLDFRVTPARTLEDPYVDGISLTYGAAGSRHHIWTFIGALYEEDPFYMPSITCPCINVNVEWMYPFPSFIGHDYFCDTANSGPGFIHAKTYVEDPLWDGMGCGQNSTCCQYNHPPWFCTPLAQPTGDDLELRICSDQNNADEDTYVYLVEIYVASR